MKPYEKTITYKTLYLTIIRRFHIFLLCFIPVFVGSFALIHFSVPKTYQCTAQLNKNSNITSTQYQVMQSTITNIGSEESPETLNIVVSNLAGKNIKHQNGAYITAEEIKSGIIFSLLDSNSIFFSFSFQSKDIAIVKYVVQEVADVSIKTLKDSKKTPSYSDFSNLVLDSVTNPAKNSRDNIYYALAFVLSFASAFLMALIAEVCCDEVHDKKDLRLEEIDVSEINVTNGGNKK